MLKLLRHPLFLLSFTLLSGLFSFSLYQTSKRSSISNSAVVEVTTELEKIKQENDALAAAVAEAQTPLAQEKIIRNELLLQKPGERVIQIIAKDTAAPPSPTPSPTPTPWEEWKEVLF